MLSPERDRFIRDIANDEWIDRLDAEISEDDQLFEAESKKWRTATQEFLAGDTPAEELHLFAQAWNWDGGMNEMRQVATHPNCDAGTALMLYWLAGPEFYLQYETREGVPAWAHEGLDLVQTIEQRYLSDAYATSQIRFDPRAEGVIDRFPRNQRRWKRRLPPRMYEPNIP